MSVFLGTGAAQGFPCPYCKCEVCEDARKRGERAVKTRSDFLIDEHNIIDFGPDIYPQLMKNGIFLEGLRNIFLTHAHEDHMAVSELGVIANRKHRLEAPVSVRLYGSSAALRWVEAVAANYSSGGEFPFRHIKLCPVEAFESFTADELRVTALLSSHRAWGKDELGLNYIIEKEGKTLLYAVDTGWYPPETWAFLAKSGISFDCVVMENTYGKDRNGIIKPEAGGHLNTANFFSMLDKMKELGAIDKNTPVFATHLSDAGRELYGDFVKSMEENGRYNIKVAYDGMNIDF